MNNALTALKSNGNTIADHIADQYAEMEYAMTNANLVTALLACDFCPNTFEVDVPADWKPVGELTCDSCQDEWFSWNNSPEDSYLDSYWESMYE